LRQPLIIIIVVIWAFNVGMWINNIEQQVKAEQQQEHH
jgi:hypothetical protein